MYRPRPQPSTWPLRPTSTGPPAPNTSPRVTSPPLIDSISPKWLHPTHPDLATSPSWSGSRAGMPPPPRAGVDQAPSRKRGYARRAGCPVGPAFGHQPTLGTATPSHLVLPRPASLPEHITLLLIHSTSPKWLHPTHLDPATSPNWCRSRAGITPSPRAGVDQERGGGRFPELVSIKSQTGSADARGGRGCPVGPTRAVLTNPPAILHLRPSRNGANPAWPGQ